MTEWIVAGDRVRFANNKSTKLGVVTRVGADAAWVRWDGTKEVVKITGLSRLDVLGSARRDRTGQVRGTLDQDWLVEPASIGWDNPAPPSELELFMAQMFPTA